LSAFDLAVAATAIAAGAVASIAGFGVGSLLTPLLTVPYGAKVAVALVALPHAIATGIRLWRLRDSISGPVLRGFGFTSAAGGLVGAYVFTQAGGELLARVLGVLLVLVGSAELIGVAQRLRFRGATAWIAGAVSGIFGGMVGNQGGIRSAGLLAFDLSPREFVATAAAIALIVDVVRTPLYVWETGSEMLAAWRIVVIATLGVTAGTFAGSYILLRLSAAVFRRVIGVVLLALGLWLLT
jgi:uncharacterized membrane protein YfcA